MVLLSGIRGEQAAFAVCCLINLLDVMGMSFTGPVQLPYGRELGATTAQIAAFQTVRFGVGIISFLWMPPFADSCGVKLCLFMSIIGSAIAYAVQGSAHRFAGCGIVSHTVPPAGGQPLLISGVVPDSCSLFHFVGELNATYFPGNSSALVSWSGGTIECEEDCKSQGGVIAMFIGRAIAGFFAGTQPVNRAFITRLCMPDTGLLKFRLTVLSAFTQTANLALAPIAGFLGRWGMHLPWYVSAAFGVVVFVLFMLFFDSAEKLKAQEQPLKAQEQPEDDEAESDQARTLAPGDGGAAAAHPAEEGSGEDPPREGPPPVCDVNLHIQLAAYTAVLLAFAAVVFGLPLLLEYPEYGLADPDSRVRTDENLAVGTALVGVPFGIACMLSSTVGFMLVSGRIGDRNTLRVSCSSSAVLLCLIGYCTSRFWHLVWLYGSVGASLGLVVPSVQPTLQEYNYAAHPAKLAQASAVPLLGITIGNALGPILVSAILGPGQDRSRMNVAWVVIGALVIVFWVLVEVAFIRMERHPAMKRLRKSQREASDGQLPEDDASSSSGSDDASSDSD